MQGEIGEKCGVFGIYGKGMDVARLAYFGLYALQHRGQESSGIAVSDGSRLAAHRDMGLVAQVYTEEHIASLLGHIAIGHNRYSTAGGSKLEHAQPFLVQGDTVAVAHNGNLPSTRALEDFLCAEGVPCTGLSDSRLMAEAIAVYLRRGLSAEEAVRAAYPLFTGAFALVVMTRDTLIALRDQHGMRPLSIAKLNGGFVIASETCAFHPIGAEFIREVGAGEMVMVNEAGMHATQLVEATPHFDVFEFVYFARPDSVLLGKSVYDVRRNFGVRLAREFKIEADVIIPVPETAVPVAIGYARESGIPMEMGLTKNRYIHRTFIQPEQHLREQGVRVKLTPQESVIKGKRVIVVDDSIVRGTTSHQIVKMLFDTGATEVHFLVSSPPVKFPDFYGIDTPKQVDLIASHKSLSEMRDYLGVTSLQFLSFRGMIESIGVPEAVLNTSCFTGTYPIELHERIREVRFELPV